MVPGLHMQRKMGIWTHKHVPVFVEECQIAIWLLHVCTGKTCIGINLTRPYSGVEIILIKHFALEVWVSTVYNVGKYVNH